MRGEVDLRAPLGGVDESEPGDLAPGVVELACSVRLLAIGYFVIASPLFARGERTDPSDKVACVLMPVSN